MKKTEERSVKNKYVCFDISTEFLCESLKNLRLSCSIWMIANKSNVIQYLENKILLPTEIATRRLVA